jgi:hypothetical protein
VFNYETVQVANVIGMKAPNDDESKRLEINNFVQKAIQYENVASYLISI